MVERRNVVPLVPSTLVDEERDRRKLSDAISDYWERRCRAREASVTMRPLSAVAREKARCEWEALVEEGPPTFATFYGSAQRCNTEGSQDNGD